MEKAEILAKFEELKVASAAALAASRANSTPETRQANIEASRALSDFMVQHSLLPKSAGKACRAGQRQWKEMEAQRQEALRRQSRRA